METIKHVGIWIRVSTDFQVQADSPEHHEQRTRYYTQAKGWNVVEVYRLDAVSGKTVMSHPETQRMLRDIRSGHITGLVFSKLARLARSTKELLEFADIFRKEGADLISLAEQIDTSSPAGRLFFTMISAMAQWEREEISSRVSASVPVRARLGKSTGGQASFGYKWEDGILKVDEKEAPIRKLIYEIFLKVQRKETTAKELNNMGYRTRNGSYFRENTIDRLLRDSTAKGERKANYSKNMGNNKHRVLKPESEWIIVPCPAVVDAELWDQCNQVLHEQSAKRKRPGPKALYLLSGYIKCHCGTTMYVKNPSINYSCNACKNRIAIEDIDEIYLEYLKGYLLDIDPSRYVEEALQTLNEKKELLSFTQKKRTELRKEMDKLVPLRLNGELSKEHFAELYTPLELQVSQIDTTLPELEAEVDFRSIQMASSDVALNEAKALYDEWQNMEQEQKRIIVETIIEYIIVGKDDIDISLCYLPSPKTDVKVATSMLVAA